MWNMAEASSPVKQSKSSASDSRLKGAVDWSQDFSSQHHAAQLVPSCPNSNSDLRLHHIYAMLWATTAPSPLQLYVLIHCLCLLLQKLATNQVTFLDSLLLCGKSDLRKKSPRWPQLCLDEASEGGIWKWISPLLQLVWRWAQKGIYNS